MDGAHGREHGRESGLDGRTLRVGGLDQIQRLVEPSFHEGLVLFGRVPRAEAEAAGRCVGLERAKAGGNAISNGSTLEQSMHRIRGSRDPLAGFCSDLNLRRIGLSVRHSLNLINHKVILVEK